MPAHCPTLPGSAAALQGPANVSPRQLSVQTPCSHDADRHRLSSACRNPYLWSDEALTPAGKAFIQDNNLTTLLANLTGVALDCPLLTPSSTKCPRPAVDSIQVRAEQLHRYICTWTA